MLQSFEFPQLKTTKEPEDFFHYGKTKKHNGRGCKRHSKYLYTIDKLQQFINSSTTIKYDPK